MTNDLEDQSLMRTRIGRLNRGHARLLAVVGLVIALLRVALLADAYPVAASPAGGIRGVVFFDADGDGVQGLGERGLAGVTVSLAGPGLDQTATTDASGAYAFLGLAQGIYTVTEADPAGYLSTTSNLAVITLAQNELREGVSFGGCIARDADRGGV